MDAPMICAPRPCVNCSSVAIASAASVYDDAPGTSSNRGATSPRCGRAGHSSASPMTT
jgi:hypothetical protein